MSTATETQTESPPKGRGALYIGIAAATVPIFVVGALAAYRWQPTPALFFLTAGWCSLMVTGGLLVKAATSFDPAIAEGTFEETVDERRRRELELEKKVLLKAIKEIEFDQAMGKIDDSEAKEIVARYRARALEILRALDENPKPKSKDYKSVVEAELARRSSAAAAPAPVVAVESVATATADSGCASCGTKNDADAVFCKKCGAKVGAAVQS